MNKIRYTSNWGGWDELDGVRLVARDRLTVRWPDGTCEDVDVKIVVSLDQVNDMGPCTIQYTRAHAIRDYHGVMVRVPLAGLEAARRGER